jgi:Kef-type K+ transport system membrane component KefB
MSGLLHDIGVAAIAATAVGVVAHRLKQPIILAYLVAGALIGPLGFEWVATRENIEIIAELGLVLLLFIIGLEMDLKQLAASGRQLLITGFLQFPLCATLGWSAFVAMGFASREAVYLALACALSSTAIVVKLLYDKQETDTNAGRLTIGVLIVQDLFAILVLAFQPNFDQPSLLPVVKALIGAGALLIGGFLISRFVLSRVFGWIARSPEMVVATSIGWCALGAGVADAMGLSQEMGALVAGASISAFPYSLHVTAKTLPLRDFFLTLFFISLGMQLKAPTETLAWSVPLIVAVVVGTRFLVVTPLLLLTGGGWRTGFISALNLAQVSEFSLVIVALGVSPYGHVSENLLQMLIYAMAVTSVLSSYAIQANHGLYQLFERLLRGCGLQRQTNSDPTAELVHHHIVVLGYHRIAPALIDRLAETSPELLATVRVVDYNPEVIKQLKARGIDAVFGDLASLDTLHHAHLEHARVVISTIPDSLLKNTSNAALAKAIRALAPTARIIVPAEIPENETVLRTAGADEVVLPAALAGHELARLIEQVEV